MPSSCTFAGVPFLLPSPEVDELFNLRLPLDGFRITNAPRTWPGPAQIGLAYPHRWPDRPSLKLNEFFYPTHISRWGEFNGLVDQAGYDRIAAACFASTGPTPATFTMSQDGGSISTQMFALPLKPVVLAGERTGMYFVTLVDQRYYLQFTTPGLVTTFTGWDSLLNTVASAIGITLGFDACESAYAAPHPKTDLAAKYASAPTLLDAIAFNTGRVIVRQWDGTYFAQNHDTAATTAGENSANTVVSGASLGRLAGGDFTSPALTPGTNYAPNSILPAKVTVTFPYYLVPTSSYLNAGSDHIPFPLTQGDMYRIEVPIGTAVPGTQYVGFAGTLLIHTTAEAYVCVPGGTPLNLTSMQTLAEKVAADWYAWQTEGMDATMPGVVGWTPEGINDLHVVWTREKTFTRVQRKPVNFLVEEYQHHFTKPACPSGSSSSSSSRSSSSSQPSQPSLSSASSSSSSRSSGSSSSGSSGSTSSGSSQSSTSTGSSLSSGTSASSVPSGSSGSSNSSGTCGGTPITTYTGSSFNPATCTLNFTTATMCIPPCINVTINGVGVGSGSNSSGGA